jgi:hypothetical protein
LLSSLGRQIDSKLYAVQRFPASFWRLDQPGLNCKFQVIRGLELMYSKFQGQKETLTKVLSD